METPAKREVRLGPRGGPGAVTGVMAYMTVIRYMHWLCPRLVKYLNAGLGNVDHPYPRG
jgi:hypothetical protein